MKRFPAFMAAALAVAGLPATANAVGPGAASGGASTAVSATPTPRMNWEGHAFAAPESTAGYSFGFDVAVHGDTAMVGAGSSTGRVFVYRQIEGEWVEQQELTPQQPWPMVRSFGSAIDLKGTKAIIGESGWGNPGRPRPATITPPLLQENANPSATDPYAAYVFEDQGGVWTPVARLEAEDGGFGGIPEWGVDSSFATAVAIDGETAAVGAFLHHPTDAAPQIGAVYLFSNDGTGWRQTQKLIPEDGRAGDQFGFSLAMSGDTLLVGARNATSNRAIPQQGSVYVYERHGGVWTQTQRLHDADSPALMQFGASMALEGDTAVVGASHTGGQMDFDLWPTFGRGAVYFLSRVNGRWSIRDKLQLNDPFGFANFLGERVALSGNLAVAGASTSFIVDGLIQPGAIHTFERVGDRWFRQARIMAPDRLPDRMFGEHVAISGRTIFSARLSTFELFRFEGSRPATAAIAPAQLNVVLQAGTSSQSALRIDNTGDEPLDFDLAGSTSARQVTLQPRGESRPLPWPAISAGTESGMARQAAGDSVAVAAPAPSGAELQFALDDGSYEQTLTMWHPYEEHAGIYLNRFAAPTGTGAFTINALTIAFPANVPAGWTMAGEQVNLVAYYDADADGNPRNATRLGSDHFVTIAQADAFLTFPVDFRVPGDGDIYVGFESSYARGGQWPMRYPGALDNTAPVFKHSWMAGTLDDRAPNLDNLDDNAIQGMVEDVSAGGNWLIRATGTDPANDCIAPNSAPWLSIGAPSGSIDAGGHATSLLSFDASGLAEGTHRATLCVATSDGTQAMVRIPVALTVLPDGVIFRDGFGGAQ